MKPPMHDDLILLKPNGTKDDQGFPNVDEIPVVGRVTDESQMIIDDRGETVQATHTVIFPNTCIPAIGDSVRIGTKEIRILKASARKSFSGRKIFYWVTNCGQ
jgi:hypothetical protein